MNSQRQREGHTGRLAALINKVNTPYGAERRALGYIVRYHCSKLMSIHRRPPTSILYSQIGDFPAVRIVGTDGTSSKAG